ncbi:hypothetical protein [Spirosoma sp. 209]|uniref:hypothetical protein n=1 Tax=Spirosoma sp. 209 TaxID=1955701 RepID=UPI00098D1C56|nr:hypothetical protein [Spirosoma sp. 209]
MRHLLKHRKVIFIAFIIGCLCLVIYYRENLCKYLHTEAKTNLDNYIVEIVAGIIVSIFPIFIGIYFGKKIKEYEFHNNIEGFLNTLIKLREKNLLQPLVVRQIVKSIATNFGSESLKEVLAKTNAANSIQLSVKCRVCNLEAETVGKKCKNCKINCYAWDLSSATQEEIEIMEIDRIINTGK